MRTPSLCASISKHCLLNERGYAEGGLSVQHLPVQEKSTTNVVYSTALTVAMFGEAQVERLCRTVASSGVTLQLVSRPTLASSLHSFRVVSSETIK